MRRVSFGLGLSAALPVCGAECRAHLQVLVPFLTFRAIGRFGCQLELAGMVRILYTTSTCVSSRGVKFVIRAMIRLLDVTSKNAALLPSDRRFSFSGVVVRDHGLR